MIELYNDDCITKMEELISNGVKVDAIISDPPYELENHDSKKVNDKSSLSIRVTKAQRDNINFISGGFDYEKVFDLMLQICKVPNLLLFCSNKQLGKTISYFESRNLKVDTLVWNKTNPAPLCNGKYVSDLEYIVYVHTIGSPWNKEAPYKSKLKCKQYSIMTGKNKVHPTQKPIGLMKELVEVHTTEEMIVLDPFMGSGSTGVACINTNRDFIGIELNEEYFNISCKRIKDSLPLWKKDKISIYKN